MIRPCVDLGGPLPAWKGSVSAQRSCFDLRAALFLPNRSLCWLDIFMGRPGKGLFRPMKGSCKLKIAICRPRRALCWSGKRFVCLKEPFVGQKRSSFGLKGSFQLKTSLFWHESSLCFLRGSFGLRGPLLAQDALSGPCQPEMVLNWSESSLCRPE